MKPSKIIITLELDCAKDISDEHMTNLASNSLSWVAHRVGKGQRGGNLHGASGKKTGMFIVSKFDDMETYKPS